MNLGGLKIISHPLAERVERVARITRSPIKKRRRGWVLRYEQVRTPCALVIGNTAYVHPDAFERLRTIGITKEPKT